MSFKPFFNPEYRIGGNIYKNDLIKRFIQIGSIYVFYYDTDYIYMLILYKPFPISGLFQKLV